MSSRWADKILLFILVNLVCASFYRVFIFLVNNCEQNWRKRKKIFFWINIEKEKSEMKEKEKRNDFVWKKSFIQYDWLQCVLCFLFLFHIYLYFNILKTVLILRWTSYCRYRFIYTCFILNYTTAVAGYLLLKVKFCYAS